MKKCEHFKDLILTDYIDGELNKNASSSMENHLLECAACRAFLKEVKNNTCLPFKSVLNQPVPSQLWDSIRQSIEQEATSNSPFEDLISRLKGWVVFPKMVPILACLTLMILAGSATLNTIQVGQVKDREQGEYLVSLLNPTSALTSADSNDLGTPIEHYFL